MLKKAIPVSIVIALAVLFIASLTVLASPAAMPEISPAAAPPGPTECFLAQIPEDILNQRLGYLNLENVRPCPQGAAKDLSLVPVTGTIALAERFMAFKDMQADLYSEGFAKAIQRIGSGMDPEFMMFKDRQAESRIP